MLGQYTLDIERILPHILLVSHMVTWTIMVGLLQVGSALGNQRSVAWRSRALSSDWRAGRPGQISAPRRVVYCRVVCTPMVVEVGRMFVGISSMRNMVGHQTTELAKPPRSAFEMCSCASSARRGACADTSPVHVLQVLQPGQQPGAAAPGRADPLTRGSACLAAAQVGFPGVSALASL